MKPLVWIFLSTFHFGILNCQIVSPGLDALINNSNIIVQGVILQKHCQAPMNAQSAMAEKCIITLKVENIIKGNPKLSVFEILTDPGSQSNESNSKHDTIKGLCFEHSRMRISFYTDTLNKRPDYKVLTGDNVILFLGEVSQDQFRRIIVPNHWTIYSTVDTYLGVITANDYVVEYIKSMLKGN